MALSFQSLAKQHNKISLDEIAQLSLTSIPQLKFLSEFHKDMIEISTSAEQIERSENVNLLIYDILKAKEFTISHEGRLATDIGFKDRLETQALLHITKDYDVRDFRKAIDSMHYLTQKSRTLNLAPVKHFDHYYHEGITHLLSAIGNEQYSSIPVVPHTQGYLPPSLDDIEGTHAVYATGRSNPFLLTFTDELSQDDFEKYRELNFQKAKKYREKNDWTEIKYNIVESHLRQANRIREIKDYFSYNPNLRDYLIVQDSYDFSDSAYDGFKRYFAFRTDDSLKENIAYNEKYHSDVLNHTDPDRLYRDDRETIILNTATKLLLDGPDRTVDIKGVSPIKNMLIKEIQKENENKYGQIPLDPLGDVVQRLVSDTYREKTDARFIEIFESVLNETNKKTVKHKM